MPAVFFDASALVRRYDRSEPGADRVRRLCRPANQQTLLISRLTRAEIASALGRKHREGRLSREAMARLWRVFRRHRRDEYHSLALDEETWQLAESLLFPHALRASDAVQLASALCAERFLRSIGLTFCTADRAQAQAARAEGLSVDLIG